MSDWTNVMVEFEKDLKKADTIRPETFTADQEWFLCRHLNGLAPVYIDEMIQRYVPNRKLRSSSAFLLKQNKWNLKSYGFRTSGSYRVISFLT